MFCLDSCGKAPFCRRRRRWSTGRRKSRSALLRAPSLARALREDVGLSNRERQPGTATGNGVRSNRAQRAQLAENAHISTLAGAYQRTGWCICRSCAACRKCPTPLVGWPWPTALLAHPPRHSWGLPSVNGEGGWCFGGSTFQAAASRLNE